MPTTTDPVPGWTSAIQQGLCRDLTAFASAAAHTPLADRGTWRALARRWDLFLRMLDAAGPERARFEPLLRACAAGFDRLAEVPDDDLRAALVVRLVAGQEAMRRVADKPAPLAIRPFSSLRAPALRVVPWLTYRLPRELRIDLLGELSPAHRLVWRLTRGSFRRGERRVFRHAVV